MAKLRLNSQPDNYTPQFVNLKVADYYTLDRGLIIYTTNQDKQSSKLTKDLPAHLCLVIRHNHWSRAQIYYQIAIDSHQKPKSYETRQPP
jgi:hypothetical protein